jgi:hypothetical protein
MGMATQKQCLERQAGLIAKAEEVLDEVRVGVPSFDRADILIKVAEGYRQLADLVRYNY